MIRRALSEVTNGFYIDIGAGDPVIDSVTKSFYDSGWSGINVEPNVRSYTELNRLRPRDTNLMVALGKEISKIDFWQMKHDGLSTASRKQFLEHEMNGFAGEKIEVECRTLSDVCKEFVVAPEIHFLKVDVEGWERDVLLGANLVKFRPWIILVEATVPNTQTDNSIEWLELLVESNYEIVYRDGLNIFFLAKEKMDLVGKFEFPPNVFDGFIKYDHSLMKQLSDTTKQLSDTTKQLSDTTKQLSDTTKQLSKVIDELRLVRESNIWKKTRWIRDTKAFILRITRANIK